MALLSSPRFRFALARLALWGFGLLAAAQSSAGVTGFPGDAAREQLELERRFVGSLEAGSLHDAMKELSAQPHYAGSPGGRRVAESLLRRFEAWGFDARIETYYALMPTPRERLVEMRSPRAYHASLQEPAIPGMAEDDGALPAYNAYSPDGDVTAKAVYVNYGLAEDYEVLARRGIDVKGKIVIARYGRVFRGIKPRLAAEMGAVGTILFSDPADYGYARGVTYPDGPFLPIAGVQRGTVIDITQRTGDPLSPGNGASDRPDGFLLKDAQQALSPVPVLPVSARDIEPILAAMTGPAAPANWQGALPHTYRLGDNVELRLKVSHDWSIVPLHNVVARLEGSTWPDEWILRGNNHDAWNDGALVALSGLVTMLEEARGIAALLKTGWRPKRTLVYLAWDGEELGLMGSTEWAEAHATELQEKAVVYINSGVTTRGFFEAGGSHSLETLVDEVAHVVRDPKLDVPVFDRVATEIWLHGEPGRKRDLEANGRYRLAALGLGSDTTPFLQHLGIPSLDYAFGGEAESGVYHSRYDTFDFFTRFVDPEYAYGVKLAEANGRTVLRLANAQLLPFDFSGMSHAISQYVAEVRDLADALREAARQRNENIDKGLYRLASDPEAGLDAPERLDPVPQLHFERLERAADQLASSALQFASARRRFAAHSSAVGAGELATINAVMRRAEQTLAPEHGLPDRRWYRHHIYAPGRQTGYSVKTLPSLREAVELGDWDRAGTEITTIARLVEAYAQRIDKCAELIERATHK